MVTTKTIYNAIVSSSKMDVYRAQRAEHRRWTNSHWNYNTRVKTTWSKTKGSSMCYTLGYSWIYRSFQRAKSNKLGRPPRIKAFIYISLWTSRPPWERVRSISYCRWSRVFLSRKSWVLQTWEFLSQRFASASLPREAFPTTKDKFNM